ncbi:MAG: hypothetical protein QOF10_5754 [Kribbellaceae bacterium]|nr:hypothetical protein [Kribbellaceae bacterium]
MSKESRRRTWLVLLILALLAGDALGPFLATPGDQPGTASGTAEADGLSVSGKVGTPLAPTSTVPIDLVLTNSSDVPLTITGLTVQVARITAKDGAAVDCDLRQFVIRPFSGEYGFSLAAATTSSLAGLGFQSARWPHVTLLDLPTNQDGCKNVVILFRVSGTGLEPAS